AANRIDNEPSGRSLPQARPLLASQCWDNAGAESLWSTVKHEYYKRHAFTTYANLTAGLDNYIRFYNHDRRHSSLGMISPIDFEVTSLTSQQSS
ncbi:integrase core domain-containing protein, partial [Gordonia sp. Z-3]|uniref:integrase core domain-containing protein n=1 Tax=Gordonia sp. Z-3 TaxID=3115408 RepID=UPI002E2DCBD5